MQTYTIIGFNHKTLKKITEYVKETTPDKAEQTFSYNNPHAVVVGVILGKHVCLESSLEVKYHDSETEAKLHELAVKINEEQFEQAHALIAALEEKMGDGDSDLVRSKWLLSFLEGKSEND